MATVKQFVQALIDFFHSLNFPQIIAKPKVIAAPVRVQSNDTRRS